MLATNRVKKMNVFKFEMTWCEYLTPCPFRVGVMIGDYDCSQCKHHKKIKQYQNPDIQKLGVCDYRRYSMITSKGIVMCNKNIKKENDDINSI